MPRRELILYNEVKCFCLYFSSKYFLNNLFSFQVHWKTLVSGTAPVLKKGVEYFSFLSANKIESYSFVIVDS